jgi:hypothetical protein
MRTLDCAGGALLASTPSDIRREILDLMAGRSRRGWYLIRKTEHPQRLSICAV